MANPYSSGCVQSDEDAGGDADIAQREETQPYQPLGSWEGVAYLRKHLAPILQGT
jgi:hypothetical protein